MASETDATSTILNPSAIDTSAGCAMTQAALRTAAPTTSDTFRFMARTTRGPRSRVKRKAGARGGRRSRDRINTEARGHGGALRGGRPAGRATPGPLVERHATNQIG